MAHRITTHVCIRVQRGRGFLSTISTQDGIQDVPRTASCSLASTTGYGYARILNCRNEGSRLHDNPNGVDCPVSKIAARRYTRWSVPAHEPTKGGHRTGAEDAHEALGTPNASGTPERDDRIKPQTVSQKILMAEDPNDVFGTTALTPQSISELPTTYLSAAARAAALSHVSDAVFLDALLQRVVRSLSSLEEEEEKQRLTTADVCNIIECFSELDYCHSIELKTAVSRYMLAHLSLFSGDMLGHTLRSFANLNFYDDELLEHVLSYMSDTSRVHEFSAENVADVVYAFSKCGFCHPDLISLVDRAGSMLLKEALHDNGEAIASIVDAYSRVGCAESETLDALVELVTQSPDKIPANALASTLASAIRLGSEDQDMMNRVLASLLSRIDDLETGILVEVVVCLGGLGMRPKDERFLETLVEEVLPYRISEMGEKDVSDVVDGLNKLGFYSKGLVGLVGSGTKV